MPTLLSPAAATWLANHHNVATAAELRRLGVGRKACEHLLALGVVRRPARGVYAVTTAHPTLGHRCRLLCCLYPGGFVTGPTGAMLGGLRRQPSSAPLHFSLRHGMHPQPTVGVRFRQTTKLAAVDRRTRPDGIVVASWPRLAFDLAADLRALDHRSVIHQLLDRCDVSADDLLAIGGRLCHPARRGSTTFRYSLMEIGASPQDSHPEVILLDALVRRGLPIEAQVELGGVEDVLRHVDLGVPEARWGIELDIHPEHRTVDGHRRDSRRLRSLHSYGWQIEPVSELDMVDLEGLADDLAALYRERAATVGVSEAPYRGAPYSDAFEYSGG